MGRGSRVYTRPFMHWAMQVLLETWSGLRVVILRGQGGRAM